MQHTPSTPYINQPIPVPEDGRAFRVVQPGLGHSQLMTQEQAQALLAKLSVVSVKDAVKRALNT